MIEEAVHTRNTTHNSLSAVLYPFSSITLGQSLFLSWDQDTQEPLLLGLPLGPVMVLLVQLQQDA